jgi:DNA-binding PadR family transcriptional regulator
MATPSLNLQQISKNFFQVHQGSLYPALHRLEDRGWLQAEWKESETGREAKFYSVRLKAKAEKLGYRVTQYGPRPNDQQFLARTSGRSRRSLSAGRAKRNR